ncbi:MAG: hypothetical protein LAT55_05675 [Opitutales bacterium]|nr:hypothetical protein [Opitutales bacterium]
MILAKILFLFLLPFLVLPLSAQVYTPDPAQPITKDQRWQQEGALAVRLVAPRNGAATAPIVVTGQSSAPRARVGNLTHENGRTAFPGSQIIVRYGWEGMAPEANGDDNDHVIWITAEVPPETTPGNYRGEINITGAPSVPIQLEVGQWLAPRPNNYKVWQEYFHSPETIARYYDVEIWSDEHFELMEPSLRLLGQVGTHVMYLPGAGRTHFGNEHTIVRWIGDNPRAQPDFSAVQKYFEMWDRLVGPPRIIISYSHEPRWWTEPDRYDTIQVTTNNQSGQPGGSLTEWPHYSQSGQAAQWRPYYEGLQEQMQSIGWRDSELMVGMVGDDRDFESRINFYREVAPDLRWATFTHARGDPEIPDQFEENWVVAGLNFGYAVLPYTPRRNRALSEDPLSSEGNWNNSFPYLSSMRSSIPDNMGDMYQAHPFFWRYLSLASVSTYRGFARQGFDWWRVDGRPLIGRYHRWNNLFRDNTRTLTHPGENGALSSHPLEMAREGNAATEAMTVIQDALTLSDLRSELSSDLKELAEEAYMEYYNPFQAVYQGGRREMHDNMARQMSREWEWQNTLRKLYDVAGEVAAATGQEADPDGQTAAVSLFRESDARTWTNQEGREITAMFVSYDTSGVNLLLEDLQEVAVPLDSLSPEDQEWVREESGYRIWRNQQGAEIEARLINTDGQNVTIERLDGQQFVDVPLRAFSEEDRNYVRQNYSPN